MTAVALLYPEQRRSGLCQFSEKFSRLVEHSCRLRLVDGKIDAPFKRAVLTRECDQRATCIDHGDVVGNAKVGRLCSPASSICLASDNVSVLSVRGMPYVPRLIRIQGTNNHGQQ